MISPAMSQPNVDVIVNNYNYAGYLGDAIESALRQSYERMRVIVVDDGSTDGSRKVIASYGSEIIPVLKGNGGQASAFNAGLERSTGDVVVLLDADDVLLPETCTRVAAAFERDTSVVRVQYRMEVIDEAGRRTGILTPPPHVRLPSGDLRRQALAFPFDVPWMATSGNAFAASALRRIFPVPEPEFRVLADWYVVHLTSLLGTVASLDQVGAYRRMHGQNVHELNRPALDLVYLHRLIMCAAHTRHEIRRLADELDLVDETTTIGAVSDVANRLISLRLAPDSHPIPGDRRAGLLAEGIRVSLRRFDVSPLMRLLFILWLVAEAAAPRSPARYLAEMFMFPERRTRLNPLLVGLRRDRSG